MTENNCYNCPNYNHFTECIFIRSGWSYSTKSKCCAHINPVENYRTDIFLTNTRALSKEDRSSLKDAFKLNKN